MKIIDGFFGFIIILFLFSACSNSSDDKRLLIGGKDYFKIDPVNESQIIITPEIHKTYKAITDDLDSLSIPLHKVIKGNNYDIFIGLPINITTKQLKDLLFTNNIQSQKSFSKSGENYIYRMLSDDNVSGRKYVLTLISSDSILTAKLYNEDYTGNKIEFSK